MTRSLPRGRVVKIPMSLVFAPLCGFRGRFRLPSRKKLPRSHRHHKDSSSSSSETSPILLLPVELLARILDFFHTKQVKLELALVNRDFSHAARRCLIHYPVGPSFYPMQQMLREMELARIGWLFARRRGSRKRAAAATRRQQQLEGVAVVVAPQARPALLLRQGVETLAHCPPTPTQGQDMFGRRYESPQLLQRLARTVDWAEGRWAFRHSTVGETSQTRRELEDALQVLMPRMETAVGYAKALAPTPTRATPLQLATNGTHVAVAQRNSLEALPRYALPGRSLQVIVRVVQVELEAGETRSASRWEVAGLPQEHIVATAEWCLERDPDSALQGGEKRFARGLLVGECEAITRQSQWVGVGAALPHNGLMPLGQVPVHPHQAIVYPNTHLVCTQALRNTGTTKATQRTLVVHLIDPDVTVGAGELLGGAHEHAIEMERAKLASNWNTRRVRNFGDWVHQLPDPLPGGFYM